MVAVPPSLSVLLVSVPGKHVSCNAEGSMKSSSDPSEEGIIGRGLYAGYAFILWVGTLHLPVLFLLSKVIVLFISLFSCHLLWGLGGIEVEKKKVQRYIRELVPCVVVFFYFSTFSIFLLLFSVFIESETM
jgi:hypothetical protein